MWGGSATNFPPHINITMEDQENYQLEQSAFDMSFSTFGRINFCLWQCNNASAADDVHSWRKAVLNLYKEAITCSNKQNRESLKKEHEPKMIAIEKAYNNYLAYTDTYQINGQQGIQQKYQPPRKIFDLLFDWELELRALLDNAGVIIKRGDSAERAMI